MIGPTPGEVMAAKDGGILMRSAEWTGRAWRRRPGERMWLFESPRSFARSLFYITPTGSLGVTDSFMEDIDERARRTGWREIPQLWEVGEETG